MDPITLALGLFALAVGGGVGYGLKSSVFADRFGLDKAERTRKVAEEMGGTPEQVRERCRLGKVVGVGVVGLQDAVAEELESAKRAHESTRQYRQAVIERDEKKLERIRRKERKVKVHEDQQRVVIRDEIEKEKRETETASLFVD